MTNVVHIARAYDDDMVSQLVMRTRFFTMSMVTVLPSTASLPFLVFACCDNDCPRSTHPVLSKNSINPRGPCIHSFARPTCVYRHTATLRTVFVFIFKRRDRNRVPYNHSLVFRIRHGSLPRPCTRTLT